MVTENETKIVGLQDQIQDSDGKGGERGKGRGLFVRRGREEGREKEKRENLEMEIRFNIFI